MGTFVCYRYPYSMSCRNAPFDITKSPANEMAIGDGDGCTKCPEMFLDKKTVQLESRADLTPFMIVLRRNILEHAIEVIDILVQSHTPIISYWIALSKRLRHGSQ